MTLHHQERAAVQHCRQLPLKERRRLLELCLQVRIASKIGIKVQKSLVLIVGGHRARICRAFALMQVLMQLARLGTASEKWVAFQVF